MIYSDHKALMYLFSATKLTPTMASEESRGGLLHSLVRTMRFSVSKDQNRLMLMGVLGYHYQSITKIFQYLAKPI